MNTRPKLLVLGDSPTVYTGFANVVRNLTARWVNHFESIDIWGINFAGWPHDYPYRIFPAGYGDWTTAAKLTQFLNLLGNKESKYTHLWILQDCNQLSGGNVPEYLRKICDAAKVKITFYYPVDAPLEKEWLDCVAIADNAVTYTDYGYEETRKANPNIHPHILPHGVDTAVYHPLPNRMELRRTQPLLDGWLEEDDFLIVNVNRNERRKSPQHSLQILRRLLDQGVKAKMVLHCPKLAVGEGTFLDVVGRQLGLPCGEHWKHNDSAFINWHGTYTEAQINELYNCADLVLNTAGGEGWGLCAHPNTPVRTPDGCKDIHLIQLGDSVLTTKGFRKVTATSSREFDGDMVCITAEKRSAHFPLMLTPEHPVLTEDGWKSASCITTNDRLVLAEDVFEPYYRTKSQCIDLADHFNAKVFCRTEREIWMEGSQNKRLHRRTYINKEFAELYGIYLAEGSACKKGIVFAISQEEDDLTRRIIELVRSVWGLDAVVENCPRSKKRWVRVYSQILKEFYAMSCGRGARNKRVGIFKQLTRHTAAKVLKGLWLGDGSTEKSGYEITTTSREMALQVVAMCQRLGLVAGVERNPKRDSYRVRINGGSASSFAFILGERRFYVGKKQPYPKTCAVKSVALQHYSGKVCDIQVDDAHEFMTHHCVIHNSLSEGLAAGCRVAAPNHTSCGEIIRKVNELGHTGRMFALPVSPQCQVNMCDNSRVRYPVDVVGSAMAIAGIATMPRGSVPLNDAVKEWLNWDRIAAQFLSIMLK